MRTPCGRRHPVLGLLRSGFTLIELMAVILIISILMVFLVPNVRDAIQTSKVTACKKNLQEIFNGYTQYEIKYRELPNRGGAQMVALLIARGVWENTRANAERLTCPAVDRGALPGLQGKEPTEWYKDIEAVDGTYTAYAGRDLKQFPLRKLSGKEPLVCDDNDGGMNHPTTTCVLYGDGSVQTFEVHLLREKGLLPAEQEFVTVGPDSEVEDLRKFTLN